MSESKLVSDFNVKKESLEQTQGESEFEGGSIQVTPKKIKDSQNQQLAGFRRPSKHEFSNTVSYLRPVKYDSK